MSEHTATPWVTDNVDVFSGDTRGFTKVCRLTNDSRDGAFICLACNAHDDLVKALERIAESDRSDTRTLDACADIARAALAKARP